MKWLKHFFWFINESASFLGCSRIGVLKQGGLSKAIKHANFMTKWDKMTPEQREHWYLTEDRIMEF